MLNDSKVISLQMSTADIMQQIVWIGSSSIRTVRTFVPEPGIPGILGVRVTLLQNVLQTFDLRVRCLAVRPVHHVVVDKWCNIM